MVTGSRPFCETPMPFFAGPSQTGNYLRGAAHLADVELPVELSPIGLRESQPRFLIGAGRCAGHSA